ncbi:SdpI family protein [Peptostreptococcus anaerobius]|uniref:SdpI family protein n=1 Tax=Peptostreptococcus anaerobius TaxID=1261 RepID=UPI00232A9900|nr:SdpI family protein [Peptostreptococcus anaerobius]MDB8850524.1 SdpI family protein [Peptostreptococcus anaerobius]MDB8854224.1 SdpI family protein [Peptostreptococcus anaerobius]MDB8856092.1 SdpI family protein [Peptostreptococcus anaerobius]
MKNKKEIALSTLLIWLPTMFYMYNTNFVFDNALSKELVLMPFVIMIFMVFCAVVAKELRKLNTIPNIISSLICISIALLFSLSQFKLVVNYGDTKEFLLKSGNIIVGVIVIIIGNYLPKMQFSRFVGLKFWWLKNRKDIWKRSHLLAGYLWILSGIIMIMSKNADDMIHIVFYFLLLYIIPLIFALVLYFFTDSKFKK